MSEFVFWVVISVTIISALGVVLSNQLIYSAISLLFTLFGIAGLYVFLWADFMTGIQLLVYVGGILTLIIFGIMLTNKISSARLSQTNMQQGIGSVVSLWLLIVLSLVISKTNWYSASSSEPASTVDKIGTLLMTKHLLAFEGISLLLLGALIGAAILARKEI
jgi:NADH:ubiquinone oxidoreductase subunit 6 (subunit J)